MTSSAISVPQKSDIWHYQIESLRKLERVLGIPIDEIKEAAGKREFLYNPFILTKRNKSREISNPHARLKLIQKRIVKNMFSRYLFPDYIIGGVKGRNRLEHPALHVRKKVVVTVDIKDCFPSITEQRIYLLFRKRLRCSKDVAELLTALTAIKGALPLGNPTSNFLANLALLPCIERIKGIADESGLDMDQYVDDQGLSGEALANDLISRIAREFTKKRFSCKPKENICHESGKVAGSDKHHG